MSLSIGKCRNTDICKNATSVEVSKKISAENTISTEPWTVIETG